MHLHRGRVQGEGLDLDANDLLHLQLIGQAVERAVPRPTTHPHVDRVPETDPLR
jgi:hypothetical protein